MSEETAIIFRGIERLIVAISGAGGLVMGWHLFKVGVVNPQSGELKGKSWSVKLQRCGPGIFFGLFGTVIMAWLISSKIEFSETNKPAGTEKIVSQSNFMYLGASDSETLAFVQGVNLLELDLHDRLEQSKTSGDSMQAQRVAILEKALAPVAAIRQSTLNHRFGSDALQRHSEQKKRLEKNPSALSDADKVGFDDIEQWLQPMIAQ